MPSSPAARRSGGKPPSRGRGGEGLRQPSQGQDESSPPMASRVQAGDWLVFRPIVGQKGACPPFPPKIVQGRLVRPAHRAGKLLAELDCCGGIVDETEARSPLARSVASRKMRSPSAIERSPRLNCQSRGQADWLIILPLSATLVPKIAGPPAPVFSQRIRMVPSRSRSGCGVGGVAFLEMREPDHAGDALPHPLAAEVVEAAGFALRAFGNAGQDGVADFGPTGGLFKILDDAEHGQVARIVGASLDRVAVVQHASLRGTIRGEDHRVTHLAFHHAAQLGIDAVVVGPRVEGLAGGMLISSYTAEPSLRGKGRWTVL